MNAAPVLRVARATDDLAATCAMYCAGLEWEVLGEFKDHQGFDGVILGLPGQPYHLEFTHQRGGRPLTARPSEEQLLVFYLPDRGQWGRRCGMMAAAGFNAVTAFNPYWDVRGMTFADREGYRVVVQNADWPR